MFQFGFSILRQGCAAEMEHEMLSSGPCGHRGRGELQAQHLKSALPLDEPQQGGATEDVLSLGHGRSHGRAGGGLSDSTCSSPLGCSL